MALQGIQPRIWRRFLLRTTSPFAHLHMAIQESLLGGERSGPPEDCGATPGYQRMVHFLETGEDLHDDPAVDLRAWLGEWRPDAFDLEATRPAFDH